MTTEPLRRTAWHGVDDSKETLPPVLLPEAVLRLMADRQLSKIQTTIKIQQLSPKRIQIDQRSPSGRGLREIVLDIDLPSKKAKINGYQVLMVKNGEKWQPEELQFALDEMAKEIVLSEG